MMTPVYNHKNVLLPGACGATRSRHVQSFMGPECSTDSKESEFCNIANGNPLTVRRE